MRRGESVEALKRLFDGTASYTVRDLARGLVSINSDSTLVAPSIGARIAANSADLVVTSVDRNTIYAAHVSGGTPQVGDEARVSPCGDKLLHLPKRMMPMQAGKTRSTPWQSGNYLFDLTRTLKKGHVCAVVGETGSGKSSFASRLRSENCVVVCAETSEKRYEAVKEKVTVYPNHWAAPQHAWLAPLRGLHRAIELSKDTKDVTLILDDLGLLHHLNRDAERPFFSVIQVMNAISAYAGASQEGRLSIALVVDGAPQDEIWQAAESVSDVTLNFDAVPSRPFWPLVTRRDQDVFGRVAKDLFAKLRQGYGLKEQVELFGDLKMHVDFWDKDEVTSLKSATAILDRYGDPSSEHYTTEMIILARVCSIFHLPRMEPQEVAAFIRTLFRMCHEDGMFERELSLEALDQALLQYRNHIDCLRPSF
eukprot:GEMP01065168.1.p1 GENE.GEMP01065168.1~~GEMP01065168.1.p1  ORF type:complete len:423 (+),score=104.74 GEMP01065168.1:40-1308(+)